MTRNVCSQIKIVCSTQEQHSQLADFCKAMGHPIRIEIMRILISKGECISGDLAECFDRAPSTISEHLKILKDADLVMGTIDGPKRCYCVNQEALHLLTQLLSTTLNLPI